MKRSLLLLAAAFLFAPVLFARTRADVAAPDFTLPTASGNVSLHDLRGKVVYVDFWASWCGPCRASFPWMNVMTDEYAKSGLVIVSINLDKDRNAADRFVEQLAPQFTVAFDAAGRTAENYRVQAMPSSFVVDRSGKIVYAHQGFEPNKSAEIEQHIKEALAQ